MINRNLPSCCEAIRDGDYIRIWKTIQTQRWLIGWFNLELTTLMGVGYMVYPLRLDLADPTNTQEKIEESVEQMITAIIDRFV